MSSTSSIEERWSLQVRKLEEVEETFVEKMKNDELLYAGLIDIPILLGLVMCKFQMTLALMEGIAHQTNKDTRWGLREKAREKVCNGVSLLDELRKTGVPDEQRREIASSEQYKQVYSLFQQILLKGGSAFFEKSESQEKKEKLVSDIVYRALRKYYKSDDDYFREIKTEALPFFLKELVKVFLPVLAFENQADPPYGIQEGDEVIYPSERITLPLSQAIRFYEEEVLPPLVKKLNDLPGDRLLQVQIERVRCKIEEYRNLRFTPRSTPIILEKGFYTEWISGYTSEGEMLVTIDVASSLHSGSNLDRIQELVLGEVVRQTAGKGICRELDEEYTYLRKLESGLRGSSRTPSFKLKKKKGMRILKTAYPGIAVLEDKREFKKLLDMSTSPRKGLMRKHLRTLLFGKTRQLTLLYDEE